MDIDPPPPSSSDPTQKKAVKKPRFTPKPPRRREPVMPESGDNNDEDPQELLRKPNERQRPRAVASHGAGSSSTNASEKMVTRSLSIAANNEADSSDEEYQEPWNYNSYYPITLPLRRPCSINPEVLDAQEFKEEKEYDETKMKTPSEEIGLSEPNVEKQMIFFQFPETLPLDKQTTRVPIGSTGKEKVESSISVRENASKECALKDLPSGHMGKMLVYKIGAVKLKLGHNILDVTPLNIGECKQDAAMLNTKAGHYSLLGSVDKKAIVTPDVDSLLDNINHL